MGSDALPSTRPSVPHLCLTRVLLAQPENRGSSAAFADRNVWEKEDILTERAGYSASFGFNSISL